MDPVAFENWLKERQDSDDEMMDAAVSLQFAMMEHVVAADDELTAVRERKHGGSRIGRGPNIQREHLAGHARIISDYFSDTPKYPEHFFRRRFRMRKSLFMRIHDEVLQSTRYFVQRPDCVGNPGLSSILKMTAAMRMFCYGIAVDAVDEYVQIGESTAIEAFKEFAAQIVNSFQAEYLRAPTEADVQRHMAENAKRGFVGMFGSLDCTHWIWKNCPYSLQGQYRDKDKKNSIILEAIATKNLWIWHAFVGMPGSNNDINIVDKSPLLVNMLNGVAPSVSYVLNGHTYNMFYLLADGIYPDSTIFVKTINNPEGAKRKYFAKCQESVRKDVERCFGVLQARFAMVRNPSRWWSKDVMVTVWKAAIIMHNMIVEDKEPLPDLNQDYLFDLPGSIHMNNERPRRPLTFAAFAGAVNRIQNRHTVNAMQEDIIHDLWELKGELNEDD